MKTANTTYRYYNFVHILYLRNECLSVFCFSLPLRAIVFLCYFFFLSFILSLNLRFFFRCFSFTFFLGYEMICCCGCLSSTSCCRFLLLFFFFMFNFFFDEFSVAPKRAWLYWYWNGRLVVFVPSFESHSFLSFLFFIS